MDSKTIRIHEADWDRLRELQVEWWNDSPVNAWPSFADLVHAALLALKRQEQP